MDKDLFSFSNINIEMDLLNEIWNFNPNNLDSLDDRKISSYAIVLAQYLIYFSYKRNLTKAERHKKLKYLDRTISFLFYDNKFKDKIKGKTKTDAREYLISMNTDLMEAQTEIDNMDRELTLIEGIDKAVAELIATIKRELTRRDNELYYNRKERHG